MGSDSPRVIHRIPHRSDDVLKGIVNYQGMLTLCVNMQKYLQIAPDANTSHEGQTQGQFHRMVAIKKNGEQWIFPVNEVRGVFRFDESSLKNIPVNLEKSKSNYLKGLLSWEGKDVGYLDEELLFFGLKRNIL